MMNSLAFWKKWGEVAGMKRLKEGLDKMRN